MNKQVVVQVAHVYLKPDADRVLSAYAHRRVTEWLTQWTCRANFKATLASSQQEGLERVQKLLQEKLVPGFLARDGVKPEHFEFEVSMQDVEEGFFWLPIGLVYATRHPVVGLITWGR